MKEGEGFVDSSLASAFDNEPDGYIMIARPRFKWLPRRLSNKFERLTILEMVSVKVEVTDNPDVMKMTRREEEE